MGKGRPRLNDQDLKSHVVKVCLAPAELADLDTRRGHHSRAAFCRAAALSLDLGPLPDAVRTWAHSARIQSCLTQINNHASSLNGLALAAGQAVAARQLLAESTKILEDFKEFRHTVLSLGQGAES